MFLLPPLHHVLVRLSALAATVVLLVAGSMIAGSPAQALEEARPQAADRVPAGRFSMATLNLKKGMKVRGMRHDIGRVMQSGASVIGFQERLASRPALRASLPKSWTLLMPSGPTGTDDNPIAFDKDVWKLQRTRSALLTGTTWRRPQTGRTAHDQYGVVAVLRHRVNGHVVRAVSFHLPNHLHNRRTGGPNYANRAGVEAMWRMAARVRELKQDAPEPHQFVALCDCNVTDNRDTTDDLVKGRITRPLRLETNYSATGRTGSGIDYVMAERRADFRIDSSRTYRHLVTDHPGIVATFTRAR
ncbi:hypothetical protein [Nocardioides sp. zg-1228]|uniref:hypothetical protein n=1 Tax=Nocardioides sp. zg-1228 TaxID=2763008 RepID=UPI0016429DD6|nr:hypothetical protein [Nocardioides sp. zg-1228]MBC2932812.1 hypothetical protein [Nocardioides sp. zg-1228]QSF58282.1 hypothetical protein JX575_03495 [Nocardioides sp. zg-1228]